MKKYVHLLIISALSVVTILALLRLGHIDVSFDTLARVSKSWLFLAFVTFYLSIIARGLRWQHILKTMDRPVPTLYAQTLLIAGLFISSILPGRAGDLGRIAMLKQDHKIPVSQGLASLATERALDVFAVLILAVLGAIWSLHGQVPPEVLELMIGAAMLFILGLIGLFAVPSIEGWLRQPGWVWRLMPQAVRPFYQKVINFGFALIHGVRDLGQKPVALGAIVAESFGIWLFDALIVHLVLLSLGYSVSFGVSLFSAMVGVLATIVPLMPGALGQFEAALISLLTLLGIPAADSALTALLVRFISLWSFIPVSGLVTYLFGFSRALSFNKKQLDTAETVPAQAAATTVES
jgi:uncharacterized protein (TIRG00374 family)